MKIEYEYEGETRILEIKDYELNPMKMRFIKNFDKDIDIYMFIYNAIFTDLDASKLCGNMQVTNTNSPKYANALSLFKYYILKIKDQTIYNSLIKLLIEQHIKNLNFEKNFIKPETKEVKVKRKKKLPTWIRQESTDLFEGQKIYIYTNTKNGEIIKDTNPDLIQELTKKKSRKQKKEKVITGNILFSFK